VGQLSDLLVNMKGIYCGFEIVDCRVVSTIFE